MKRVLTFHSDPGHGWLKVPLFKRLDRHDDCKLLIIEK